MGLLYTDLNLRMRSEMLENLQMRSEMLENCRPSTFSSNWNSDICGGYDLHRKITVTVHLTTTV